MPPASWYPIFELLTRHGIDHGSARSIAIDQLRHWELHDIEAILNKIKRPSRDYSYFRTPHPYVSTEDIDFQRWWPSLWTDTSVSWVSPPRHLMEQSARDTTVLCVNTAGEWSLRTSGYVALSHVWTEGLERDQVNDGVEKHKVQAIFELLRGKNIKADWVWSDVLAIPSVGAPTSKPKDEKLKIDLINQLPLTFSRADAVIIIDALVLQLHPNEPLDAAVMLACGKWVTRVWTFQEVKLANRAMVVTATRVYNFKELVDVVKALEGRNYDRFHRFWLRLGIMQKDEDVGLSIPDIVTACLRRKAGQDIDYARAFFPVLGLEWEYGMTREQGMQKIYHSYKLHATRVACFYGAPRMSIEPRWAPSYFHHLEGYYGEPMEWEDKGVRGEWYTVKIASVQGTFRHGGRLVFDLDMDCEADRYMQCACAPNENENTTKAFETAVKRGTCYVLSGQSSKDIEHAEFARTGMLVEDVNGEGLEVVVHCATIIHGPDQHLESKRSVLLRHHGPLGDGRGLGTEVVGHRNPISPTKNVSNFWRYLPFFNE